jgi:hypothetical protein
MNALQTLKNIRDDMENSKHWLEDSFKGPSALSNMSTRIQAYAQQLKELEEERIKDLLDNGPKATGNICDITITLLRDGKEKHIEIGEYNIQLAKTDKEETIKSLKLDGLPDSQGMTHFIKAVPGDWGQMPWGVWISKGESEKLSVELARIYKDEEEDDDYWRQDHKCTFCGSMASECGEDHGDEMRDIMREALRGDRY